MVLWFSVLTLLYLSNSIQPTQSIAFHLESPTTYVHSCTPQGTWAVMGNLTIAEADLEVYSTNLTFEVEDRELCTIDLELCPARTSPMTSPTILSPDVCQCLGRFNENDFRVYIRRAIKSSETGLALTATIPALPKFSPIKTVYDVGKLPAVSSGNITYSLNDEPATPLKSVQNITTCKTIPLKIEVCIPTAQPGTVLKLSEKEQITLSHKTCIHIIEQFTFKDNAALYPVVFTYDEGVGCPFQEQFLMNVYSDENKCAPATTPTTSTSTSTTTTTMSTSTAPPTSCRQTPTSLARQPATLSNGIRVLCDTQTDGGDWVIIQRRTQGDVDFYRGWDEYVAGFGNITGDFWMGLQDIHTMCPPSKPCDLRVDLKDPQHNSGALVSAQYTSFSLGGFTEKYELNVGAYNGTAGNGLSYHKSMQFSTYDRNNDKKTNSNCAEKRHGAWWFGNCCYSDLNGLWGDRGSGGVENGVYWSNRGPDPLHLTYSEMKVRVST